ncbi:MAG: hypothetical protein ACRDQI_12860 [Pseudonocardiaceae bacterium]
MSRYQRNGRRPSDEGENPRCRESREPPRRTPTLRDVGGSRRDGGVGEFGNFDRRRDWRDGGLEIDSGLGFGSQRLDGLGQRRVDQLLERGAVQPHLCLITVALSD